MSEDYSQDLEVINAEITERICVDNCGAKCCNFRDSDHSVMITLEDFTRLYHAGITHTVTFAGERDHPHLMNKLDGTCVHLSNENKCNIYEIRPAACRAYPFRAEKDRIPAHCELFHRTPHDLSQEKSEEPFYREVPDMNLQEIKEKYQNYKEQGDTFIQKQITEAITMDGGNAYWNIYTADQTEINRIKKIILSLQREYTELEWYIFSIRYFTPDGQFKFQINGLTRQDYTTDIPMIKQLPPDHENLISLLQRIETSSEFKEHFVAGLKYLSR